MRRIIFIFTILLYALTVDAASPLSWYNNVYGTNNFNGQITLKDANGQPVTAASNPTGANVTSTQSSSVQPPVIVQANATLPVVAAGSTCNSTTDQMGISADHTSLLTCQNNVWKGPGADTSGLYGFFYASTCPTGWIAADGTNGTIDLRGTFLRGLDNGRGLDAGRTLASYQGDVFANHSHAVYDPGHTHGVYDPGHSHNYNLPMSNVTIQGGSSDHVTRNDGGTTVNTSWNSSNISIYGAGTNISIYGTGSTETRPKNMALLACMKS
jgi:hypothetical protein